MKKKTKTRLLKLARHLSNFHINELLLNESTNYSIDKGDNNIECFFWVLIEFPGIFSEWEREYGVPYLKGHREMNSLSATAYYFNLDMDSLFHLFVSGYQMPEFYYGKPLGAHATPSDLANNIYEYLRFIEESEVSWVKFDESIATILLSPLNNQKHETDENKLPKMCA